MGFLYQVLKDVSDKQPYSVGKTELKQFVDTVLFKKLSTGREGFEVIQQVARKVGEYNERVKKSNNAVKMPIDTLLGQVDDKFKTQVSAILNDNAASGKKILSDKDVSEAGDTVQRKLNECLSFATSFTRIFNFDQNREITTSVNDLNFLLAHNVKNAVSSVKHERRRLEALTKKEWENFLSMRKIIREAMENLCKDINKEIADNVKNLVEQLKGAVTNILRQMNNVYYKLGEHVYEMQKWIEEAEKLIKDAERQLEIIEEKVNWNGIGDKPANWKVIDDAATFIGEKATELYSQFETVKHKYADVYNMVKVDSDDTQCVVRILNELKDGVSAQMPKDIDGYNDTRGDWAVQSHINGVTTKIGENIKGYVCDLAGNFKLAMEAAQNGSGRVGITKLHDALESGDFNNKLGTFGSVVQNVLKKAKDSTNEQGTYLEYAFHYLYKAFLDRSAVSTLVDAGEDVVKALHTALHGKAVSGSHDKELFLLLNAAILKGIEKFQTALTQVVSTKLDKIEELHNKIDEAATKARDALEMHAAVVSVRLADMCKNIMTSDQHVKEKIKNLEAFIKNDPIVVDGREQRGMNNIKNELNRLHQTLFDGPINDAYNLVNRNADTLHDQIISQLKVVVDKRVTHAIIDLTTAARRNYVTSVKQLLTAFANKVSQELAPLPGEIDRDLTIGFKGLMGKMEKQFIAHTKTIKDIKTNDSQFDPSKLTQMKRATLAVKMGFQDFIFNLGKQEDVKIDHEQIKRDSDDLMNLLSDLNKSEHFDHVFASNLRRFEAAVNSFSPERMKDAQKLLLMPVKHGLKRFSEELKKAYVSTYSCQAFDTALTEYAGQLVTPSSGPEDVYKLTGEGRRAAKIFLTLFNTIYEDLDRLKNKCGDNWGTKKLCKAAGGKDNALGLFLQRCGYEVASDENSKEGELRFPSTGHTGAMILAKLLKPITGTRDNKHLQQCKDKTDELDEEETKQVVQPKDLNLSHILDCILRHSDKYNDVCHMSTLTAKRQPCSVYEMLVWLSGLTHNAVYPELLRDGIGNLLDNPNDALVDEDGIQIFEIDSCYIDTFPHDTTYSDIEKVITDICSISYDVAICVAGTGDADTIYGSDLCNNAMKFRYPTSGEECLDMFLDILRRLILPLTFLRRQCSVSTLHNGWRQCYYGRDVSSANLPCKDHSSDRTKCQPTCQPMCEPNCQPKSPLQSYLSDCLTGHLPHVVTSIGCKYDCQTCPNNKRGMPCLTPLGFRGFSGATRKGRDICDVLDRWFKITNFRSLFCLVLKTPQNLAEHFAFGLSLANGLNAKQPSYDYSIETVGETFTKSIESTSMNLYADPSKLKDALTKTYGSESITHTNCDAQHLISLTRNGTCDKEGMYCAPFLYSLCSDYSDYRRKKHAGTYLSWAVYLPWDFWKYLKSLYEEFCNIKCQNWGCRPCLHGTTCKAGEHGILDTSCRCSSVVNCRGVLPTLYKYGFTFANAANLSADKKTCFYLHTQLKNVIKSKYFTNLFDECDNFLYYIRFPFMTLTLALWLLSFLYLLHIMVIRLDLLHIKSHLHSPSSHRIAAQSLLAAGRVNKLNRVFYLQP